MRRFKTKGDFTAVFSGRIIYNFHYSLITPPGPDAWTYYGLTNPKIETEKSSFLAKLSDFVCVEKISIQAAFPPTEDAKVDGSLRILSGGKDRIIIDQLSEAEVKNISKLSFDNAAKTYPNDKGGVTKVQEFDVNIYLNDSYQISQALLLDYTGTAKERANPGTSDFDKTVDFSVWLHGYRVLMTDEARQEISRFGL